MIQMSEKYGKIARYIDVSRWTGNMFLCHGST